MNRIIHGLTVLSEEGVDVGSWRTGTKAIKIRTIGLGGDSIVTFDKNGNLTIGPCKATPLSWLAQRYPEIKQELKQIRDNNKRHSLSLGEFFYLVSTPEKSIGLTFEERNILRILESGPKSKVVLSEQTQTSIFLLRTERLEQQGIVARAALTPSDLMHVKGDYKAWDTESAKLGAEIMANRLSMPMDALLNKVYTCIVQGLYNLIVEFLLADNAGMNTHNLSKDTQLIMNMAFENFYDDIRIQISSSLPIVGIGAPAHIFLNQVATALGTKALLTEYSGVANAVGAITGSIVGEETVLIKPRYDNTGITSYGCHGFSTYFETENYDEALSWAETTASEYAKKKAEAMGAVNIIVKVHTKDNWFRENEIHIQMETTVTARAIGNQAIFNTAE